MGAEAPLGAAPIAEPSIAELPIAELQIAQLQDAMASGRATSVSLTIGCLDRIARLDRAGPRTNAVPVLSPAALSDATRADAERAAGLVRGPLHGIPFTVKDSFSVAGLPVANGSPALSGLVAREDARTVELIRAGGGVLIGKTTMPPMAKGGVQRGLHGRAENPYNPRYLSAAWLSGSSNGSAVSVAAGYAAFGLGEETVSSGRSPASNNGLVAYTPSRGLISIRGNWPLWPTCDVVVPHTRTVADLLAVLQVVVADDPDARGDLWREQTVVAIPHASQVRPADYRDLAGAGALRGRRFGVPRLYRGTDPDSRLAIRVRPSIARLFDAACRDLESLGAELVEVDLPIVTNELGDRDHARSAVERGLIPREWHEAERRELVAIGWEAFLARVGGDPRSWTEVDPAAVFPAGYLAPGPRTGEETAILRGEGEEYYAMISRLVRDGLPPPTALPGWEEGLRGLEATRVADFEEPLRAQRLDGLVMPANVDIGEAVADLDPEANAAARRDGVGFSTGDTAVRRFGIPTVTVPMGTMADTGVPVGLSFWGPAYSDAELLAYASDYEQRTRHRTPPPLPPVPAYGRPSAGGTAPVLTMHCTIERNGTLCAFLRASGTVSHPAGESVEVGLRVNGHAMPVDRAGGRWSIEVPLDRWAAGADAGAEIVAIATAASASGEAALLWIGSSAAGPGAQ